MNQTRRNVLAGAAAAPFVIAAPLAAAAALEDPAPVIAWREAVAGYHATSAAKARADVVCRQAESDLAAADPEHMRARLRDYRAAVAEPGLDCELLRVERAYDAASSEQWMAFERVVATPAPDLPALIEKTEIMIAEWTGDGLDGATVVEAEPILADMKRLARVEGGRS